MPTVNKSNPQSSEVTDIFNNSNLSETVENPVNSDVQPIAGQSENAQPKSTRPTAKQRKSDLEETDIPMAAEPEADYS